MRYRVVEGRAVAEGDIDLGPIERFRLRANIVVDTTRRWPGGSVHYTVDPEIELDDPRRTRLVDAIDHIEARTPIHFVAEPDDVCPVANPDCIDHIFVTTTTAPGVGGLSALGRSGGRQNLRLAASASTGTIIHELGHALGLYHEQNRPDRNSFVTINLACIDTGDEADDAASEIDWTNQYDQNGAGSDFGTYDFGSIMHYSSSGGRDEDWQSPPCSGHQPMERKAGASCPASICSDPDGDGVAQIITAQRSHLSIGDIDAIWGMYASGLGASEAGDRFGAAIAAGDFDGDGEVDVAVGAPGEDIGGVVDAGAVFVWKGTGEGFQPWLTITEEWLGGTSVATDELGAALTVGDLDGDGITDLVIGAPGEVAGTVPDAGAVFVARGSALGLQPGPTITAATAGGVIDGDDRFGFALASADFDGDGIDDLAIGAPSAAVSSGPTSGRVFILRGGIGGVTAWDAIDKTELIVVGNGGIAPPPVPMGTAASGDRFGWALAAGRVDLDARADLMVGAMCDSGQITCGGAVYLFQGGASSMRGWRRLARATPAAFDRLGWSVAIFDRDGDGDGDLAAGAPFATVSGQAGAGLVQLWNTSGTSVTTSSWFSQSGFAADEIGDQFGASLASVQHQILFSPAQLFVGVPVEGMNGEDVEAGVVQRFTVTGNAFSHNAMIRESPGGAEEEGDEFGRAVAVHGTPAGTFIFVGAPGENDESGAVYVLGALGNVAPGHRQVLVQHGKGTHTAP